jgi:hypothetical protein
VDLLAALSIISLAGFGGRFQNELVATGAKRIEQDPNIRRWLF